MSNVKKFELGMKIYNSKWYFEYNLSYDELVRYLKDWGINFVLAVPPSLPMPNDVKKNIVPQQFAKRFSKYNDQKFRQVLLDNKIKYFIASTMFFDPTAIEKNEKLRPIDNKGKPMLKDDWYIGIPPSFDSYVNKKKDSILASVRELKPDGIFLTFMRWPGFWEIWTSDRRRLDFSEYSFDKYSLKKFNEQTDIKLPELDVKDISTWIYNNVKDEWVDWKCNVIENIVNQIKRDVNIIYPGTKIMLNGIPFGRDDFDNAEIEVFGQRPEKLGNIIDLLEVMTYFQILKKPVSWIKEIIDELSERFAKKTYCTIPSMPYYIEGNYTKDYRKKEISLQEFKLAIETAIDSKSSGAIFFGTEIFEQIFVNKDTSRINIIKNLIRGA